jgi:dTDP-4-amino-4,6-dideoxygalactose transaminase
MDVPFFSFKMSPKNLQKEWLAGIEATINGGIFIKGNAVSEFERAWSEKLGIEYSVGVSNGQDGLILALRALQVKPGDVVAVPAHAFIAVHNAVLALGATPYSIDVDINGLIDIAKLYECTVEFKAVIVVHMHGAMVDMILINKWASKANAMVIEDCSQSHLAVQNNIYSGGWGDIGVFSLYPTKNLGALGDAGVVVTRKLDLFNRLKELSNYGSLSSDKYTHTTFGTNNRLDEIQAAVLNINLKYLEIWIARRIEIAMMYTKGINQNCVKLFHTDKINLVWHHFCILSKHRTEIKSELKNRGIDCEIHYPKVAAVEVDKYRNLPYKNYKNAEKISNSILSLPISPWHSDEEILYVISEINKISTKL